MKNGLWKLAWMATAMVALKIGLDTNLTKVNQISFQSKKLSSDGDLRILQISDMHNKQALGIHHRLLKKVKALAPDIIILTGDVVDRRTTDFNAVLNFIDRLLETGIPVYFVTGNHEWGNRKGTIFIEELRKREIVLLENNSTEIYHNADVITLVGIHDTSTDHEDIEKAFEKVKDNTFTILLSHSPYAIKKYPDLPEDLVLSGHTHGGQVRLPLIGAVISPGGGMFPELDKGVFQWEEGKYIYVDSGLGTSMIPVRFLNQSQISLIQIKRDN